jgi:hypothetical protein
MDKRKLKSNFLLLLIVAYDVGRLERSEIKRNIIWFMAIILAVMDQ